MNKQIINYQLEATQPVKSGPLVEQSHWSAEPFKVNSSASNSLGSTPSWLRAEPTTTLGIRTPWDDMIVDISSSSPMASPATSHSPHSSIFESPLAILRSRSEIYSPVMSTWIEIPVFFVRRKTSWVINLALYSGTTLRINLLRTVKHSAWNLKEGRHFRHC